jgi:UDP-3-O-[3-hydroxymyristoyl] glucosamine N-acyltransferase
VTDRSPSGRSIGGEGHPALTASAIAVAVKGTLRGDPDVRVTGVAPLDRAERHHVTFLASAKYAPLFAECAAGVALVSPELADSPGRAAARVLVDKPHEAMLSLLESLYPEPVLVPGVHPTAVIGRGARLGAGVAIGPYVVIGEGAEIGAGARLDAHAVVGAGVSIGERCLIYPGATLYPGVSLGDRVRVHAGVRLGSDGFGYVFRGGRHDKIPHVGRCIIESDVEIGANTTIDRGSIDDTRVGAGTKIDNLVQIGHNVRIGRLCLIMA